MLVFSQTIPPKALIHGWKSPFPVMVFQFNIVWKRYAILFLYYNPQFSPIHYIKLYQIDASDLWESTTLLVRKCYIRFTLISFQITPERGIYFIYQNQQNFVNGILSKSYLLCFLKRHFITMCYNANYAFHALLIPLCLDKMTFRPLWELLYIQEERLCLAIHFDEYTFVV